MNGIDDAWKKVFDKQARYRFVIDMGGQIISNSTFCKERSGSQITSIC